MPLFRRTRTTEPAPPSQPRGASGRGNTGGIIVPDEHLPELTGTWGIQQYDRIWRSDADARKALMMIVNAIAGATWSIDPAGTEDAPPTPADEEAADLACWALIDGDGMQPRLTSHITEALRVCLRSGAAPFEQVWRADKWKGRDVLIPDTLALRLPRTIYKWHQEQGKLIAIEQLVPGGENSGTRTLPIQDLVVYRVGAEGDNWAGESLLRPAYKHWYYKDKLELIAAIAAERQSLGTPVAYTPTSQQQDGVLDALEEALAGLTRAGESSYLILPGPHGQDADPGQGWRVELLTPKASETADLAPLLEYHSGKIAASVIEEFMRLGQAQVGARATADVQQDPFLAFCEALAQTVVEDTLNAQLLPRLTALNVEGARPPKVRASLIDSTTLSELADYAQKLSAAGALHPDQPLEEFFRKRADLPPADPEAVAKREEAADQAREALAAPATPGPPAADSNEEAGAGDKQQLRGPLFEYHSSINLAQGHDCPDGIDGCMGECQQAPMLALAGAQSETLAGQAAGLEQLADAIRELAGQGPPSVTVTNEPAAATVIRQEIPAVNVDVKAPNVRVTPKVEATLTVPDRDVEVTAYDEKGRPRKYTERRKTT